MPSPARLLALPGDDLQNVRLALAFPAPGFAEPPGPADATIEFGDGERARLGWLAAPADATWRDGRLLALTAHTYRGLGPYTARLLWDSVLLEVEVQPGVGAAAEHAQEPGVPPGLSLFAVDVPEGRAMERSIRLQVTAVAPGARFRLDGGAGQAFTLESEELAEQACERRFKYAKNGLYIVSLDLLDADGYHVLTCAEQAVEVGGSDEEGTPDTGDRSLRPAASPRAEAPVAGGETSDPGERQPWLPFRYVRPVWGWLRTYTSPGGTNVARVLASGTYLSIHGETFVSDELWYQTAARDWIPAAVVEALRPSELRGLDLSGAAVPRGAGGARQQAIVVPGLLNVRASPGVRADNAPTAQLRAGTPVTIAAQAHCGENLWYQIEPAGWVQASGLRLLPARQDRRQAAGAEPQGLPMGWVLAPALQVRPRPGAGQADEPLHCLAQNAVIPILEARRLGSGTWYCIGDDRWVDGSWVAVAQAVKRPMPVGLADRWLAVSRQCQTAVAYEADRPVYAALVSSGLPGAPTPAGLFRTSRCVASGRVTGGNPAWGSYYDLEDVPWINYFFGGYALLGAYWHTGFGRARSHGCVNLTPYDAWWIYRWGQGDISVYIY